ncbi:MAG: DUF4232 domain-containing protein [Actinobacteria bacterium]|nr:DUF4232 domain-containing protein [Actinomycetota bacterium]
MPRTPALLGSLLLVAAICAGCGASGSGSNASSTTSSAPSTTRASSTTTIASTTCTTAHLQASIGQSDAGAGQLYAPLVFVNTGATACTMRGFPGVSILDQAGDQLGQPASREGAEGASVTLAPNGTASAILHTTNGGTTGQACTTPATSMRIYPPDNTAAMVIINTFPVCGGFSVGTVVAGATGR